MDGIGILECVSLWLPIILLGDDEADYLLVEEVPIQKGGGRIGWPPPMNTEMELADVAATGVSDGGDVYPSRHVKC